MSKDEDKLLVRIAEMYYQEDKNQNQISKELKIHRSTISRLLKRSRNEGIVSISINYDKTGTYHLEKQLMEIFSLKKVIIVSAANELSKIQKNLLLAEGLDNYLKEILQDDMIIGFSWGETMAAIPKGMSTYQLENILCVPMIGGPSGRLSSDFHVNTITYEASKKLNGRALLIDSPALPDTIALKQALMQSEFNQQIVDYWKNLDLAILGIGSPTLRISESWNQFYGKDILADLEGKKVVGDIVSRFYNGNGEYIANALDERLIGIDTKTLKKIPYRIGVAESLDKAPAILAALKGNYVNVLISTEETAQAILAMSLN